MFDKCIIDTSGNERAARILARSNAEHDETLKEIYQAEIKSKDRVDIPLSKYNEMREELDRLRRQNDHMNKMVIRMGIPAEVIDAIDPNTIHVHLNYDPVKMRTWYRVHFGTDKEVHWKAVKLNERDSF